jgi:FK506-binding protein 1
MTIETLEDLSEGSGPPPKCGDKVVVHYSGYLASSVAALGAAAAKPFDCSRDRGHAYTFTVGVGKVIQGWDDAMLMMPKGSRRRVLISADDAYGERGRPPTIPPNSNLIFDIEVLNINEPLVEEGLRIRREEQMRVERFLKLQDEERAKEARGQQPAPQPGASASSGAPKRRKRGSSSSGSDSDSSASSSRSSSSSSESERKRRKREKKDKEKRKRKHEKRKKEGGSSRRHKESSKKEKRERHREKKKHKDGKKEKKRKRDDDSS